MRTRQGCAVAAIAVATAAGWACTPGPISSPHAAGPMNNPVPMSSEAPTNSVEMVRRQLMGTWRLAALETIPASATDGRRVPVDATGTLTYDEYGNLTIDAHTKDPDAPVAAREVNLLTFKGRAVIDVPKQELKLMDLKGNVNPDDVLSPDQRRKYEFALDTLKLSSIDASGRITTISTWQRQ